ncbi:Anaphase-promoting complex APC subunit CDC26 [Microdochium nivale]|nr:Anaphase-promoting complex APC subunit CDC26 [Microdochium nivale]
MLRRPPTALSLTAEDIAAYEDMRAQNAAREQEHQQQQQKQQPQHHGLHSRHPAPQSHHHQQQPQPQLSRAAMLETSPAQSLSNRSSSADEAMADVADLSDEIDLEDDDDEDEDDDHEDSYYTQRAIRRAAAMDDPFVQPSRQQPSSRGAAGPASSMQARGGATARTLFAGQASRTSRLQRITGTAPASASADTGVGVGMGATGPGRGQAASTRGAAAMSTTTARQPSIEAPGALSRLMRSREDRIGLSQPQAQAGSGLGSGAGGGSGASGAAPGARRR